MGLLQNITRRWRDRERREHRRHRDDDLRVTIQGKDRDVLDWSLGGCRIRSAGLTATTGDRIEGAIRFGGSKGEFGAEVLETNDDELSARFIDITPSVLLAMSGLGERS